MGNLDKRQLRRAMATGLGKDEEFLNWANDYCCKYPDIDKPEFSPDDHGYLNTYFIKQVAFDNFKNTILTSKQASEYKITKFKLHMNFWCEYKGYDFNPDSRITDHENKRIMITRDNKSKEHFYISTTPKDSGTRLEIQYPNVPATDEIAPF